MIDIAALLEAAAPGAVRFDSSGTILDVRAADYAPAVMVVSGAVEAVKRVEGGFVVGSVDRDTLWVAEEFILTSQVLAELPGRVMGAEELVELVVGAGYRWRFERVSASSL